MIQKRSIATCIVLSLITCGIYALYWFVVLTDDVKKASEDQNFPSGGMALLLTIITCGIYGFYWAFKMGEFMKIAQEKHNLPIKDYSILYVVLELFGLSIITSALIQDDLNKIADQGAN